MFESVQERAALIDTGRAIVAEQFPDLGERVEFAEGAPGLERLVSDWKPNALRLSPDALPMEALTEAGLSGVHRLILPCSDPSEAEAHRARLLPVLEPLGFKADLKAEENGSVLLRRD